MEYFLRSAQQCHFQWLFQTRVVCLEFNKFGGPYLSKKKVGWSPYNLIHEHLDDVKVEIGTFFII